MTSYILGIVLGLFLWRYIPFFMEGFYKGVDEEFKRKHKGKGDEDGPALGRGNWTP